LNKAKPTCSRPQSSIEVDAEGTDLDIVFVDQIPDLTLQLTAVLDAAICWLSWLGSLAKAIPTAMAGATAGLPG